MLGPGRADGGEILALRCRQPASLSQSGCRASPAHAPPWAPEVPYPPALSWRPRGVGRGLPGAAGLPRSGEARSGGRPAGRIGRGFPGGERTKVAGLAGREGASAAPPVSPCALSPPCEVAGRPWVCAAPSSPAWRGPRLECNRTCPWGWPGERGSGWTGPLQVGWCAPGGCAGAWHSLVSGGVGLALCG